MSLLQTIRFITSHALCQDRKLDSLVRYTKWQLGSRLVPGAVACDWVNGSRFLARAGETGITGNVYTGLHEFEDMGFLLHLLRPEDFFVDIGANVGSYTILAAAAVGARSVAFEPVPSTFERLVDNAQLNRLAGRVQCINKGLGAKTGTLAFTCDTDTTNHAVPVGEQYSATVQVEVTTLDEALQEDCPLLMKIDVEGFETSVLDGAANILRNPNLCAVIMELNGSGQRYGFDETSILHRMQDIGFDTYTYAPLERTLRSLLGGKSETGNTLFIRKMEFVAQRLATSPRITVNGRSF